MSLTRLAKTDEVRFRCTVALPPTPLSLLVTSKINVWLFHFIKQRFAFICMFFLGDEQTLSKGAPA
jgi:hypothetical protein